MVPPCPKCGSVSNKPGVRFCAKCGAQISGPTDQLKPGQPPPAPAAPAPATPVPPTMVTCLHCGALNRQGARFCMKCRQPLPQATGPGVMPPPAPPPPPPRPIQPPPYAPPAQAAAPIPVTPPYTPPAPIVAPTPLAPARAPAASRPQSPVLGVLGLIALTLCLCVSLAGILAVDARRVTPTPTVDLTPPAPPATLTVPPPPPPVTPITLTPTLTPNPPHPVVSMQIFPQNGRFGFMTKEGDPNDPKDDNKPLTFRHEKTSDVPNGQTNNTRVQVDDKTPLFGDPQSGFVVSPTLNAEGSRMMAVWQFNRVVFTQTVYVTQSSWNRLDTFRIQYDAENRDTAAHAVGMRLMIDTMIGENDGVPFNVPGGAGVITSPLDLKGSDIPDYVQVYENPGNPDSGVKVQITLKGGDATPPDRFVIAPWCNKDAVWDFLEAVGGMANHTLHQCGDAGKQDDKLDSAVGIYFDAKPLAPGETRSWTTFYGLGQITRTDPTSALAIALGQRQVRVGDQFWVTALVQNPKAGQRVRIDLPPELERVRNDVEQAVPQVDVAMTQVSWLVQAKHPKTDAEIKVTLSLTGATPTATTPTQTARVTINPAPAPIPTPAPTRTPVPCTPSVTNPLCP